MERKKNGGGKVSINKILGSLKKNVQSLFYHINTMELAGKAVIQMNLRTWLGHTIFNIGFWTFFWGAFELAYQSPSDPIWSGTFDFPYHTTT